MGGPRSTRWRDHTPKPLIEQALPLDLIQLRRAGALDRAACAGTIEWRNKPGDLRQAVARYVLLPGSGTRQLRVLVQTGPPQSGGGASTEIVVPDQEYVIQDIHLGGDGIRGRVSDSAGRPLKDAVVSAVRDGAPPEERPDSLRRCRA